MSALGAIIRRDIAIALRVGGGALAPQRVPFPRVVVQARQQSQRGVGGGLAHPEAAGDIEEDVIGAEGDAGPRLEDGEDLMDDLGQALTAAGGAKRGAAGRAKERVR